MTTTLEKYSHWAISSLRGIPYQLGMSHPAENYLKVLLGLPGGYEEITNICEHRVVGADLLLCLGQIMPAPGSANWRTDLISKALHSTDTGKLDAAISLCEIWGESDLEIFTTLKLNIDRLTANDRIQEFASNVLKEDRKSVV